MIKPSHPQLPLSCNLATKSDTSSDGYAFLVHISSSDELIGLGWFSPGMCCRTKVKGLNSETSENLVETMAQGTADMAGGAVSGVIGAATGATKVAEGVAGSVKNTFGSNEGSQNGNYND
ncbi:hypothetical protein M8C21_022846, partial [Ambrosia artemisiifolia]